MLDIILQIISEWDPIDFFPFAPKDEYIGEARKIQEVIKEEKSITVQRLSQEINRIFLRAFDEMYVVDTQKSKEVAECILKSIQFLKQF